VIGISGVLIYRGGWIGRSSGQTSYEGITAQIEAAAGDTSVRGVALEIDSFGCEVAGVFDLADRICALRREKPVWAFVAEHAFSAGYALASQADRILLPRTGALGSIGVVVMDADLSGQLDQVGMRVTLIHSGRHKVDGNPYAPLPDGVRDDIQREIDVLRFLFAETVAAQAGRLGIAIDSAKALREARPPRSCAAWCWSAPAPPPTLATSSQHRALRFCRWPRKARSSRPRIAPRHRAIGAEARRSVARHPAITPSTRPRRTPAAAAVPCIPETGTAP
jgi:capsid assembly protease